MDWDSNQSPLLHYSCMRGFCLVLHPTPNVQSSGLRLVLWSSSSSWLSSLRPVIVDRTEMDGQRRQRVMLNGGCIVRRNGERSGCLGRLFCEGIARQVRVMQGSVVLYNDAHRTASSCPCEHQAG